MFFANEQRDNVREENPGISFGECRRACPPSSLTGHSMPWEWLLTRHTGQVGKVLGERWKALNEKQRTPYESKAKADKERYETEKASYNVSVPLHAVGRGPWLTNFTGRR